MSDETRHQRPVPAHRYRVMPLRVGSIGWQKAGDLDSRRPEALWIAIDVDAIPGLREVFRRQREGHEFDVVTCWRATMPEDESASPYAIVSVDLLEVDMRLEVMLEVDEYKESLLVGIRTGWVMLVEPELSAALQVSEPHEALDTHMWMGFQIQDASPVIGLVSQRFDLPLEPYRLDLRVPDSSSGLQEFEAFIQDATLIHGAALASRHDGPSTIILVDPGVAKITQRGSGVEVYGRWATIVVRNAPQIVRFDAFMSTGERIGSWLVVDPPSQLIRAGSAGAHYVLLLPEQLSEDPDVAARQQDEGILARVEHVEALRLLLTPPPPRERPG